MTILDTLLAESPPIVIDGDGVARIGQTRVRLETVIVAFHGGASAEEIALKYPSLELTDVYSVLAYYLRHQGEVDAILEAKRAESSGAIADIDTRFPPTGIRERLLARKASH